MLTSAAVSLEEYLHTTYDPDREYVAGQLVERNVGEYYHSRMQLLIALLLGGREQKRRFRVFTEQRVRVSDEPRYRIPDICVKALPHAVTPILERPDLVIEVLSPDDRPSDLLEKIVDYQKAGIRHIWIVDPYARTVFEANGRVVHPDKLVLETELVGAVDFGPLFAQLAEPAD